MGIILNLRGTAGSGKTELARRIMARYEWPGGGEAILRPGRRTPIAWRLRHPAGLRPLVVLGHYGATVGGCDTIGKPDGGLAGALALAERFAAAGHDVVLEGLGLSAEVALTARMAERHPIHVLWLNTAPEECVRRLLRRWRRGRAARGEVQAKIAREHAATASACAALEGRIAVRRLAFQPALSEALRLFGVAGGLVPSPACAATGAGFRTVPTRRP